MSPVRLLIVSNMFPSPEAPFYGTFVAAHVEALKRDPRFEIELAVINNPRKGLWTSSLKYSRLFANTVAHLTRFRPQVVHYHYALPTALFAPFTSPLFHPPYVVTLHGGDFNYMRHRIPGGDWLMRRVLGRAKEIIAVSATLADDVDRFLPQPHPPLSVINMGVDLTRFEMLEPAPLSRLAFVGQLIRRKGVDTAIRAIAIARRHCPDLRLSVIGDGPERQALGELAESLGVRDAIVFLGPIEPEAVPTALKGYGVLLVPSQQEPLGLVALEGMAAGLIVVASEVGGLAELVCDLTNGRLAPPDDPEALASRLVDMQGLSTAARDQMRQAARKTAEEHATQTKVAAVARILLMVAKRGVEPRTLRL